jgi:hypothetical protein
LTVLPVGQGRKEGFGEMTCSINVPSYLETKGVNESRIDGDKEEIR